MDDILSFVHNSKDDADDSIGEFKKIDQIQSTKPGKSPKDHAKEIESVLDWFRNKPVNDSPGGDDVPFRQLHSVHMSQSSPEERKKDVYDILDWIHSKKNDSKYPTGVFK